MACCILIARFRKGCNSVSPGENQTRYLTAQYFDPEDGGTTTFRNIRICSANNTATPCENLPNSVIAPSLYSPQRPAANLGLLHRLDRDRWNVRSISFEVVNDNMASARFFTLY